MRRFQMMLNEDLDAALQRRAEVEDVSKAELLRRFAQAQLIDLPPLDEDPPWQLVGADDRSDDDRRIVEIDDVVYGRRTST